MDLLDTIESASSLSLIEVGLVVLYVCASRSNENRIVTVSTCQTVAMLANSEGDQVIRLLDIAQLDGALLTSRVDQREVQQSWVNLAGVDGEVKCTSVTCTVDEVCVLAAVANEHILIGRKLRSLQVVAIGINVVVRTRDRQLGHTSLVLTNISSEESGVEARQVDCTYYAVKSLLENNASYHGLAQLFNLIFQSFDLILKICLEL